MITCELLPPRPDQGLALHALIMACPPLDANSPYLYHLLCRHHAGTCLLATADSRSQTLAGAITAYRLPEEPTTLFIWQVAIAPEQRGQGLARSLLETLVQQHVARGVRMVETTIGPDNAASRHLFESFAARRQLDVTYRPFLSAAECGANHDAEELLRLGPLPTAATAGV